MEISHSMNKAQNGTAWHTRTSFFPSLSPACTVVILYSSVGFYARQHICCSAYMPRQFHLSVRPSVCLSVTRVYCIKTAESIIEILSPSDRPNILVFRHQRSLRKSDGFTPNGGAKYKGVAKTSNFQPICGYISERVLDRGIVTMEDEYKVVCALSNSTTFDDLE